MTPAVAEIRDVLAGRPGGVNRLLRRYGKAVVDYCTALIPDRKAPFDRMVEDVLVDILAQSRAAARSQSDDEVFEFAIEAALRTVRSRYREVLDASAQPKRATQSYQVDEVLERTGMSKEDLVASISEGRIRAIRADDSMKVVGDGIPGLGARVHYFAYHVSAAERELLCLHYRLGFSPETIARWAGESTAHMESLINSASEKLASGMRRGEKGPAPEEAKMRRYIDGRMDADETSQFERGLVRDKIAQKRLDDLRSQSQAIKELFDSPEYDFSAVSVNVRSRNPHHALALPPTAALWVQVVGIAAMMLMFHRVGAYVAPPDVRATVLVGEAQLPPEGRVRVGDHVKTSPGAQVLLQIDGSNRLLLAGGTDVELQRPREEAREVLTLHAGEVWGRFTSAGHAFVIAVQEDELGSDSGAEFDLAATDRVEAVWPENAEAERRRALAALFTIEQGGLRCTEAVKRWAGFQFGADPEGVGLRAGDLVVAWNGNEATDAAAMAESAGALRQGDSIDLLVRRGDDRIDVPLLRLESAPHGVLRVFHGAVMIETAAGRFAVNRGQWALLDKNGPPLIGRRGYEDFRSLRISPAERFKESLHWLNTESYPLRAENSVLAVDRGLRELAQRLETLRGEEVRRNAQTEIIEFEAQMKKAIREAELRIEAGNARAADRTNPSDEQLVSAREEIMGAIAHWRRQSGTGIYTTLGDAAKTMQTEISRDQVVLKERDGDIGRASSMFKRLEELKTAIERQDTELAKLVGSEFHDQDGSKRAAYDAQIKDLDEAVRVGAQASSRLDLVKIKLNDLDARIDEQRRKLPELNRNVDDAQSALAEIEKNIAANIYTPEALKAAEQAKAQADDTLAAALDKLEKLKKEQQTAAATLRDAKTKFTAAKNALDPLQQARDEASDLLTDAIARRVEAQKALDDAKTDVDDLQDKLDGLPENDPTRTELLKQLNDAKETLAQAETKLKTVQGEADAASKAKDKADKEFAAADAKLKDATKARDAAQQASATADAAVEKQNNSVAEARERAFKAESDLAAQEEAKVQLALLQTRKLETEGTLGSARESLAQVQARIEALEKDAEPRREDFKKELAIVKAGEEARDKLRDVRRDRDRYQAVTDEIDQRRKDRAALAEEQEGLQNADLVKNYDQLVDEYSRLHSRVRAMEYTLMLALAEDTNFGHKQKAAQDRFRDAAAKVSEEAVALLDTYCPAYSAEAYEAVSKHEKSAELRAAVLKALWSLYYDSRLQRSDDQGSECYYVLVQSSAPQEAFNRLDAAWRKYLAEALGKEAYEKVSALTPDELEPREK